MLKEKIKIYSYMTLMIKFLSIWIQGHLGCLFEPKSSITLRYPTNLKSALEE